MRISCVKENLAYGVQIASNIATRGGNLPILNNILIKTEEDGLTLSSTNLEIGVKCKVRAKIEEPGEFTLPAKLFTDYIGALPNEKVDLVVKNDHVEITCGGNSTKIKGMPASEFPLLPSAEGGLEVQFPVYELLSAFEQVLFTVSPSEVRPEISGVLFQYNVEKEKFVVVGTDSYRLAERTIGIAGDQKPQTPLSIIVPLRTLHEFVRIFGQKKAEGTECKLIITPNQIVFRGDDTELVSRLISGQYPDYTQIIPKSFVSEITINRKELHQAVKMASLFSKSGVYDIHIGFDAKDPIVNIESGNTQVGEHKAQMPAVISGEAGRVTFNFRYLLEGLASFTGDEIIISVVDANNPCMLTSKGKEGHLYIVMPIRQE